ncbi:MAG: hypothetical protein PHO37_11310 [Kiritimatiellae bacterium]|nr:hypothetical protein [Kiritimatiellia bacterium]
MIDIAAGATLSGAGERYLKIGSSDLKLNGTLAVTSLSNTNRIANLAAGTGTLVLGSGTSLAASGTKEFAGSISGTGGLIKVGTRHLYLNNSFSGALEVREGYLGLMNAAVGDVSVSSADAGLAYAKTADLIGALNNQNYNFISNAMVGLYVANDITSPALNSVAFGMSRFLKLGPAALKLNSAVPLAGAINGVIGQSEPCVSPGAINLVKEGHNAQIFHQGSAFLWKAPGAVCTNIVNANVTVNNGAVGFSGNYMLGITNTVTVNAGGVGFIAGWSKELLVHSKLSGTGGVNVNYAVGSVVLDNYANHPFGVLLLTFTSIAVS